MYVLQIDRGWGMCVYIILGFLKGGRGERGKRFNSKLRKLKGVKTGVGWG